MSQQQKYEVRFNNGLWGRFDTYNYGTVEVFALKIEAEAATAEANKKFLQRRQ